MSEIFHKPMIGGLKQTIASGKSLSMLKNHINVLNVRRIPPIIIIDGWFLT